VLGRTSRTSLRRRMPDNQRALGDSLGERCRKTTHCDQTATTTMFLPHRIDLNVAVAAKCER